MKKKKTPFFFTTIRTIYFNTKDSAFFSPQCFHVFCTISHCTAITSTNSINQ